MRYIGQFGFRKFIKFGDLNLEFVEPVKFEGKIQIYNRLFQFGFYIILDRLIWSIHIVCVRFISYTV